MLNKNNPIFAPTTDVSHNFKTVMLLSRWRLLSGAHRAAVIADRHAKGGSGTDTTGERIDAKKDNLAPGSADLYLGGRLQAACPRLIDLIRLSPTGSTICLPPERQENLCLQLEPVDRLSQRLNFHSTEWLAVPPGLTCPPLCRHRAEMQTRSQASLKDGAVVGLWGKWVLFLRCPLGASVDYDKALRAVNTAFPKDGSSVPLQIAVVKVVITLFNGSPRKTIIIWGVVH
ncbi:hypothetical protein F2P81_024989 [Scophthalmus maximus]|uniref:Uncharacterized protein n=1 Tax=Scophthalmus maximus TaxID=52904 RepID=A0A6A4RSI8_SCOMX|nr:hypothetical protein F2P81_024989 [Scophthalmus maximus]